MSSGPIDFRASVLSPLAALGVVFLTSLLAAATTGVVSDLSELSRQDIPLIIGAIMIALASFGGLPEARMEFPVGGAGITFVLVPFLLTALTAYIIHRGHARSEMARPVADPADRLLSSLISGGVLVIANVAAWFILHLAGGQYRLTLTCNIFFLAAGSLLIATLSAMSGRQSVASRDRACFMTAFSFVLKFGLAYALPIALIVCTALTIAQPWGASSWLLLGNIASSVWMSLNGGLITWDLSLAAVGGPASDGTAFLIAFPQGGVWTGIAIIACVTLSTITTILWSRRCHLAPRFALPAATILLSVCCLAGGAFAAGYATIGADTTRFSALILVSPLSVPVAGLIGLGIDTIARLIAPTHSGSQMPRSCLHRREETQPSPYYQG